jgi:branched-chain amino acid transport system substrate-binding protein
MTRIPERQPSAAPVCLKENINVSIKGENIMKKMRNHALGKLLIGFCVVAIIVSFSGMGVAAEKELKIGVLGVMSGPSASWGLVCKFCAMATARMYNEKGGVEIDGEKYKIKVVAVDDKNDPKLAVSGAERLVYQEGIKYIIGPNIDPTAVSIVPVLEAGKAMNVAYSWERKIYSAPHYNSVLGMVAGFQVAPILLPFLKEKGVKTMSLMAVNFADGLMAREWILTACKENDIKVLSKNVTWEPGTTDFFPQLSKIVPDKPDAIAVLIPAPATAPLIIKAARELGFKGQIFGVNAMDIRPLNEIAGDYATGFISPGGASSPAIRNQYMEDFIKVYNDIAGEWNDEAGTKSYALEMILATLKVAGKGALTDIELFKAAIPKVSIKNPFLKEDTILKYTGEKWFGQPRQVGVPLIFNEVRDSEFKPVYMQSVD